MLDSIEIRSEAIKEAHKEYIDELESYQESMEIAYEYLQRAQHLIDQGNFDDALYVLERGKGYATNNASLLDKIKSKSKAIKEARKEHVKLLENQAIAIFQSEEFDVAEAQEILLLILNEDKENNLAKTLWKKFQAKLSKNLIKILFLSANTSSTTRLRLDREVREIENSLRLAQFRDNFEIRHHWAVRASDLQGYLLRYRPNIVHFSGHGSVESEIILENDAGDSHFISGRALSKLFSIFKDDLHCVVLNACYSEKQANAIATNIDFVAGMSNAISDTSAISFSKAFYQALGYGETIKNAFELGCIQIDLDNLNDYEIPKLISFMRDPGKARFVDTLAPNSLKGLTAS